MKLEYGMTVGELRSQLEGLPEDLAVVLSRDVEGNGFSPLSSLGVGDVYVPETNWSGEVHLKQLTEEDKLVGYTDEDVYSGDDGVDCIVLVPIN